MLEIKLFHDNSEEVEYTFKDFSIKAKKYLLSDYPNLSAVNHWHDDLEFTIILKGKMTYCVNGKSYVVHEGQSIFVNSQQMHYGYSNDGSNCSFICILIHPSLLSSIERLKYAYLIPLYTDPKHPFFILDSSIPWQRNVIEILHNIYQLCNIKTDGFELHVMSLLYTLCFNLWDNFKTDKTYEELPFDKNLGILREMVGYIQHNYQHKIKLNDIATAGKVCRSNCCKIFQSILQKSPIAYLNEYRLDKSIELLHNSTYSITEIALQCGFSSSSYFTEIFHREIGYTPSEYRKREM